MFLVWLNLDGTGAQPVLCETLDELGGGFRLGRPRLVLTHGGRRYQPIEYVVPLGMVDSYARVEELVEAPAPAEVEPPPPLRVVNGDDRWPLDDRPPE